ncbi:unnamed protein product [Ranitomeya imitator]|uniref:Uncharacterized protein n=1 Tax=Ranitomeya imitator TaxID=111125 RepID=A0ABN9KRG4_9NEOB|nr:unnamed protein product [Ranitomeya imitator]
MHTRTGMRSQAYKDGDEEPCIQGRGFHNVKPECLDSYNKLTEEVLPKLHQDADYPCDLVGNWNTWYGEQDQAVHLWRFSGGYPALMDCMNKLKNNKEYLAFREERSRMLLSRRNQLLLEFSFWNEPTPRKGPNIYELRTYRLKTLGTSGKGVKELVSQKNQRMHYDGYWVSKPNPELEYIGVQAGRHPIYIWSAPVNADMLEDFRMNFPLTRGEALAAEEKLPPRALLLE